MGNVRRLIFDILHELRDKQLTRRRNGAKRLRAVLDDGVACADLDLINTDRHKTPLWASVAKTFLTFAERELTHALDKKRDPWPLLVTMMPQLVRRADESIRLLHTVVPDLVKHLLIHLEIENGLEAIEESYAKSCAALLSVPEYANTVGAEVFEHALRVCIGAMERSQRADREQGFARILEAMLCNYGYDVHHILERLVQTLSTWCNRVDRGAGIGSAPVESMFRGFNAVLARCRGDIAGVLQAHGRDALDFCQRHFLSATRAQREVLTDHLRLQLASAYAEAPAALRMMHSRSCGTVWEHFHFISERAFSAEVLNMITPAATLRGRVDVFRLVEPGAPRQILRLQADLVFYDAVARRATLRRAQGSQASQASQASAASASQASRGGSEGSPRKRARRGETLFLAMVSTLSCGLDAAQQSRHGVLTQQASQITGEMVTVQASAYGWSLALIATLQLRGEQSLAGKEDIAGLVRCLRGVAAVLLRDPRDLLLVLLVLVATGALRVLDEVDVSDSAEDGAG
eukprot:CAMPEP_0118879394 /NCGR_PEP_ID=MMETSP1163-20130328/19205_1 /TAXON_ID=124430 /ORGANISM="Phaeomonas parva, Strain CCMP2877" /LENGTH=519 /DNA_ID=CAMNT_0006815543 /DNA_START=292 /DNA_END=1847 /DNA_ORIENTATION=-